MCARTSFETKLKSHCFDVEERINFDIGSSFFFLELFPMLGTEHDFFGQLNRHFENCLCKIF